MVSLTERAATEVKRVMSEQNFPEGMFLRVGVSSGGCSGFEYAFGFDEKADPERDLITDQHGIKVAVQKNFDLHLDGTVIDFYEDLQKRGFKFENPNVSRSCGCGSSFSV